MSVTSEADQQVRLQTRDRWLDRPPDLAVRSAMDRPLTSYYLLLGGATLLLAIGLMMVLSASSVYSYRVHGSSYYIFLKQLTWVLHRAARRLAGQPDEPRGCCALLAWPAVLVAVVLLALTQTSLGFAVNGNRNWLAARPVHGAALRDRQARDHPVGAPTSTPRRRSCSATRGTR